MINVSPTAASKISELLTEENKEGSGLRVFVQGGGCSGFQYGLMIEEGGSDRRPGVRVERREAVRRSDQHPLPERRRGRLRRHRHRRRLHDQEPERHVDLRLRVVVQRRAKRAGPRPTAHAGHMGPRPVRAEPDTSPACTSLASRPRTPASRRRQALQQARSHRQRVPPPGGTPQRRRSRRPHPPRRSADQPRHRLPHAAVDGRRRHRAQGRFRRGPLPLRALVPPSAALPPDLQDLQPVVRVPELRHRGADRGSRRGAQLHARARACVQIYGTCEDCRTGRQARGRSTAARPSCCSRATRCASRSRPSAAASSSTRAPPRITRDRARPRGVPEARRGGEGASRHARDALRELLAQDPQLESRPTFLFFKGAANGLFAAGAEAARPRASTTSRR